MKTLQSISNFAGKYFAFIVILFSVLAFMAPSMFTMFSAYITILLGIVMFGMGLTLKASDFKLVFTNPIPVLIGLVAQFSIMPAIAFVIAYLLNLPPQLAAGLVLLGSVPGGTSSNVMVFLAKGNVPLSITMTSVSTLLAPVMTPMSMFMSIIQVIIIPIILGLVVSKFLPIVTEKSIPILPLVSIVAITIIISAIIAGNKENIATAGVLVFVAVLLHNAFGLLLGYFAAKLFKLSKQDQRAISIEVGMQNAGLGVSLANSYFSPLAALPSAFSSAWQVITGTFLATYWAKREIKNKNTSASDKPLEVKRVEEF